MNQATNLIQYKNHTDEQKADFDFENYKYEEQKMASRDWVRFNYYIDNPFDFMSCYRLVIEPDKYYMADNTIKKGSTFTEEHELNWHKLEDYTTLRPAKPDEIPKPEKTLEDRIKEEWPDYKVVMLFETNDDGCKYLCLPIREGDYESHTFAQSMRGYYYYVYEKDNGLFIYSAPTKNWTGRTVLPVAVLFEEGD